MSNTPQPPPDNSWMETESVTRRQPAEQGGRKLRPWLFAAGGLALGFLLGLPAGAADAPEQSAAAPASTVTVTVPSGQRQPPVTITATPAAPSPDQAPTGATSCKTAREAILTGSKGDIDKALKALVKDKTADALARESAQDALGEDDQQLRAMHLDNVQLACSLGE